MNKILSPDELKRKALLEKILAGWLFAPDFAYNYYARLHNELCDLTGETWKKVSFKSESDPIKQ